MLAATMLAATYSIRPERPSSTPESSPGTEPILPGRNPLTPDEWIVDVIYHELQDHYRDRRLQRYLHRRRVKDILMLWLNHCYLYVARPASETLLEWLAVTDICN